MSMRDRPRLSDRIRGKTGDDLMNEFKKEFEDSRKAWFGDRPSAFNSFKREGFPFENDNVLGKKSDAGIKSHLEDLAKKHPEFANDLRCPPWGGSLKDSWDKAFHVPLFVDKNDNKAEQHNGQQTQQEPENSRSAESQTSNESNFKSVSDDGLKQRGLRNTVDIAEQLQKDHKLNEEPKRSCSAPPDTAPVEGKAKMNKPEQKRFTSKIEITPVNPYEAEMNEQSQNSNATNNFGSSSAANSAASTGANNDSKSSNNFREIPIHTSNLENQDMGSPRMGRARTSSGAREIPIHADRIQTQSPFDSPTMGHKHPQVRHIPIFVEGRKEPVMPRNVDEPLERNRQFQQEQASLKRKLDANGGNRASAPQTSNGQSHQKQQTPQEKEMPVEKPTPVTHSPPPPYKPKDPMERIQEVKEEVQNLTNMVEKYNGNSRSEKDYLYLDEMLTRNLIKLDTIEVEGNDTLRTARKDVIKSIQKSIALLESKVPLPDTENLESQNKSIEENSTNASTVNPDKSQAKETTTTNPEGKASG